MNKCFLLLLVIFGLFVNESKATHVMGSDLSYECLGNNKYKVTLKIYRDCTGVALTGIVGVISSDTFSGSFTLTKKGINDLTPLCSGSVSACDSQQSGISIGAEEHIFEEIIDLSKAPYSTWIASGACEFSFGWGQCCRNSEISTGFSNKPFYSEATLNICNIKKTKVLCNTSPKFKINPIFYACCNNPFYSNFQGIENTDYDSLSYKLVTPKAYRDSVLLYNAPFSDSVPMTTKCIPPGNINCKPIPYAHPPIGFFFDEKNGDVIFTPTKCDEVGIVVMEITEWRKDSIGKYLPIGTIRRDIQIIVMNCGSNYPPSVISAKYDYTVCEGDQIKITIDGKDSPHPGDPNGRKDTVSLSWDSAISQAKFKVTNPSSREKKGELVWQTKIGDAFNSTYYFTVSATDDACPMRAKTTKGFAIKVLPRAKGTRIFNTLCGLNGLEVDVSLNSNFAGPATYSWELYDSNSTYVANSTSKKDTFKNLKDGKYFVKLTLNNKYSCSSILMDTVMLSFSSKGKTLNLGTDTTITDRDSLLLNAGNGFASYNWNDNSTLQTLLIDGPKVKSGQFVYFVNAKDSSGCSYSDSIQVIITSTIGINEWNKKDILLYPTPSSKEITLELPKNILNGTVQVLSMDGKVVINRKVSSGNNKVVLNIEEFPVGMYLVKLSDGNNSYQSKFYKE